MVSRTLSDTGLEATQLEMELTESMVMHDADAAIATLQGLKSLGVALSVETAVARPAASTAVVSARECLTALNLSDASAQRPD